jgi:hypothetical protein
MVPDSVEMFNKTEILRQFDRIDAESGFICASSPPIARLTDSYFEPWEAIVDILPALLMTSQLRNAVHKVRGNDMIYNSLFVVTRTSNYRETAFGSTGM